MKRRWYKLSVMLSVRDILSALRAAAVWLLVVSVFLGPAGIGSASAIGVEACGVLCPCDEAREADPCDDEEATHEHEHEGEAPDETCFNDCSGCTPGVTLATAAMLVTAAPASAPDLALAPSDAPTTGVYTGVFRPPRSLV